MISKLIVFLCYFELAPASTCFHDDLSNLTQSVIGEITSPPLIAWRGGVLAVRWEKSFPAPDMPGAVRLGECRSWYWKGTNKLAHAMISIASDFEAPAPQIRAVILHEIGHCLYNLRHTTDEHAGPIVMRTPLALSPTEADYKRLLDDFNYHLTLTSTSK